MKIDLHVHKECPPPSFALNLHFVVHIFQFIDFSLFAVQIAEYCKYVAAILLRWKKREREYIQRDTPLYPGNLSENPIHIARTHKSDTSNSMKANRIWWRCFNKY